MEKSALGALSTWTSYLVQMVGMGVEISNMLAYKLGVIDARRLDNVISYFPSTGALHTAELIVTKVS